MTALSLERRQWFLNVREWLEVALVVTWQGKERQKRKVRGSSPLPIF